MASIRQKLAAKKVMENYGNISKTMREVGYSAASAKNPKSLTDSKSWKALMKEYFPDEFLAKKHKQLLNKQEVVIKSYEGENEIVKTGEIDREAVRAGLDMAYKLKGKYAAEKIEVTKERSIEELDEEERLLAEEERRIRATYGDPTKKDSNSPRKTKKRKRTKKTKPKVPDILPE